MGTFWCLEVVPQTFPTLLYLFPKLNRLSMQQCMSIAQPSCGLRGSSAAKEVSREDCPRSSTLGGEGHATQVHHPSCGEDE